MLEIVDTVYLVAYFRPSDSLHDDAVEVVESLGEDRVVSQAALVEFDLLMKSRGLSYLERIKAWSVLSKLVGADVIEPVTPLDMVVSSFLAEQYGMDYFDSLIAAQCITRKAEPLTTDESIRRAVSRAEEVVEALESIGVMV